jgi:hypothetical protein
LIGLIVGYRGRLVAQAARGRAERRNTAPHK